MNTTTYKLGAAPRSLPLLGHVTQLFRQPLELFESVRTHGDVVVIRLGRTPAYVINHPDLIRQVLVQDAKKYNKGVQFERARPYIGNGVLSAGEPLHLRQRRLMQPAFHHAQITRYAEMMRETATAAVQAWSDGQVVAMNETLLLFTLEGLTRTLFSIELDPSLVAEFTRTLPEFLDGLTVRVALPFKFLERLPTPGNRRFDRGRIRLRGIVEQILVEHRARQLDHADLLSTLVHARDEGEGEDEGAAMSDEQLHDEIMTMLLAGTETTANTLSWASYLLSIHPEIQERVHAEICEVVGDRPIAVEDLRKLAFTRHVLAETQRMYPAVWLLSRSPIADVELGGHNIPAGSHVLFCPYALHRDPAVFPDPTRFDPERWQPQQRACSGGSRETFFPFGAGMRGCIGESYALTEMMIFLASLITRWRLRPVPGQVVRPIVKGSLQPNQLAMIVERRT
ncbi:cytochrome P450 [Enhygromyxa salina]|nr:cytochrome P450 [Enhygromyxa salina]